VSYFVIPFQSHARTWVTIGMEAVVAQAFQAVYPVSHGFVFAYPDGRAEASRAIRRLADDLRAGEYGRHAARTLTFGDHLRRADDSMLDAAMLNGGSRPVEGGDGRSSSGRSCCRRRCTRACCIMGSRGSISASSATDGLSAWTVPAPCQEAWRDE
jgi:hypothetical protein